MNGRLLPEALIERVRVREDLRVQEVVEAERRVLLGLVDAHVAVTPSAT
jgi:hypothetical protein